MMCQCEHCGDQFDGTPVGGHRIVCGDATSKSDVAMCLGDAKPNLMVTDPPYGVDYDPSWRADPKFAAGRMDAKGNATYDPKKTYAARGVVHNDDVADWSAMLDHAPVDVAYMWHGGKQSSVAERALTAAGFELRSQIIWRKAHFAISRGDYHWQHEPCWYAVRKGAKANWSGDRKQTTVWDIVSAVGFSTKKEGPDERSGHSTQKPVECMKRPIENNSRKGDYVYEPFSGSGTTIIAGEMTGRRVLAIEIDPSYVQVSIERWQKFTGRFATLDGKTLEQVAKARKTGRAVGRKATRAPKAKGAANMTTPPAKPASAQRQPA